MAMPRYEMRDMHTILQPRMRTSSTRSLLSLHRAPHALRNTANNIHNYNEIGRELGARRRPAAGAACHHQEHGRTWPNHKSIT
jgi:hypothetical protein